MTAITRFKPKVSPFRHRTSHEEVYAQSDSMSLSEYMPAEPLASTESLPYVGIEIDGSGRVLIGVEESQLRELLQRPWFITTLRAIERLPWRTDDWRSDGTKRVNPRAVSKILSLLAALLDHRTPAPSVVPTWGGGVQAEWHRHGLDLEIEATPEGILEYFFSSPSGDSEGAIDEADLALIKKYLESVTSR